MRMAVALLILVTNTAGAAIGTITESVNAPPSIQRKAQTLPGAKGTGLEMMDTVRTTQGKVGLTFADKTRVDITENSKLVIDDFVYDPNSKKGGKLAMKVAMGTVRYASGQVAKNNPQAVSINTPTATIGVRGTDFTATVDELGRSTIILLPSCPKGWTNIERDCVTGKIEVTTDEGMVVMDQAFQATRVESRETKPLKPVILDLDADQISNILVLSPPKELQRTDQDRNRDRMEVKGALDVDFLAENQLINVLEQESQEMYQSRLARNMLDNDLMANILDIVDQQLAAQAALLARTRGGLLPDHSALTGVIVELDEPTVTLCREASGDVQCITTPTAQDSTITQTLGGVEVRNRVNSGGGTVINATQN